MCPKDHLLGRLVWITTEAKSYCSRQWKNDPKAIQKSSGLALQSQSTRSQELKVAEEEHIVCLTSPDIAQHQWPPLQKGSKPRFYMCSTVLQCAQAQGMWLPPSWVQRTGLSGWALASGPKSRWGAFPGQRTTMGGRGKGGGREAKSHCGAVPLSHGDRYCHLNGLGRQSMEPKRITLQSQALVCSVRFWTYLGPITAFFLLVFLFWNWNACPMPVPPSYLGSTLFRGLHRFTVGEEFCLRVNCTSSVSHILFRWYLDETLHFRL